ncbi:MAG: putative CRISPR-associated protein [Chloroflexales bacterium]
MPRSYILSTCGTSLLTHGCSDLERKLVTKYSNEKERQTIPADDAASLDTIIANVGTRMATADQPTVARLSAELNALVRFYEGQPFPPRDEHVLLCTDTWLGEAAARLVETWLRQQGCTVMVLRQRDLQTAQLNAFQLALSDLVRWIELTIPGYRKVGYRVIFNLTGGFKSVQGFLQSLAPFYADEVVYVFESQKELLRIPRLPVRMAATETVRANLTTFRRLSKNLSVEEVGGIPETLLLHDEGKVTLSPWGELIWSQVKGGIYAEQIYPSPSSLLVFGPKFADSVKGLAHDRKAIINARIDDLARYLESGRTINPPSLDFKVLHGNPMPPSTHDCDAWAGQDAKRLFGHFAGTTFVLDKLDKKLPSRK